MFDQVVLELLKSVLKSVMKDSRQEILSTHLFKDQPLVIIMLARNIQMKFILKSGGRTEVFDEKLNWIHMDNEVGIIKFLLEMNYLGWVSIYCNLLTNNNILS